MEQQELSQPSHIHHHHMVDPSAMDHAQHAYHV
jgi:hypothetical protein